MQCSLTITPHYDLPADSTLRPFHDDPQVLSAITEHPDITDAWDAFQSLLIAAAATLGAGLAGGGVTAAAVGGATLKWVSDELKSGMDKKYGDVKSITFPSGALLWCNSQNKPLVDWGDQLLVSFRAWSEDEIKQGADGHVEQPPGINAGITDQGGGSLQTLPANVKPKRVQPRLDGRAPISLQVAMAIPIAGQNPAATPLLKAPTVLPRM